MHVQIPRNAALAYTARKNEKVRVLIALLHQSGIFRDYGIRVQVTADEKVILIRFSSVRPRNSRDRANGRMLVLGGADIGMRFSRIDSNTAN